MSEADIQNIFTDSRYTIQHNDDVVAKRLLKEIGQIILAQDIQKNNPALFQKLEKIILQLKIVNLPNLSEDEATEIIRNHYLDSYAIEVSMENRLTAMLFFYPEIPRDELRKKLKKALMENQQFLGLLTVAQWIQEFEKMFDIRTRELSASVKFVSSHPKAIFLNPVEKSRLQELLYTYDYLLVTTLPATGPVLTQILATEPSNASFHKPLKTYQSQQMENTSHFQGNAAFFTSLPIADAMKQFPELGEQAITANRIQIMSFPDPVRPSIKNWIADYTYNLGREIHDPIVRSNYLFHSKNTQGLSSADRAKLSYVLKAFDEKSMVTVDKTSKKIIFSDNSSTEEPKRDAQISNPMSTSRQEKPTTNDSMSKPVPSEIPANKISFSSPQKLAYERKDVPQDQPYRITPATARPQTIETKPNNRVLGKNVVNLRDN